MVGSVRASEAVAEGIGAVELEVEAAVVRVGDGKWWFAGKLR